MRLFSVILLFYCFMKSIYYGLYEFNENKNKPAGTLIIILAFLGFALPVYLLFKYY